MAEKWKTTENVGGSVVRIDAHTRNFGGFKIGVAELRSRRFSDRLNRTGETPNLGPLELTNHRQKHKNNNNKVLISRQISKFLNQVRSFIDNYWEDHKSQARSRLVEWCGRWCGRCAERERSVNGSQGDIPFLGLFFNSENQQLYNCTAEQIYEYTYKYE